MLRELSVLVMVGGACGGGQPRWSDPPQPLVDDCPDGAASREGRVRTVPVRVRVASGRSLSEAAFFTRWAAAYWRRYGVVLEVDGAARFPDQVVFGGTPETLLDPVRSLLAEPRPGLDVVFVAHLAEPGSLAARWFAPLVGFTVGPNAGTDPVARRIDALAATAPPTVFVALDAASELPRERARFVLAHEVGHALGLDHVTERGNLMGPGFPRCAPTLDEAQQLRVRSRTPSGRPGSSSR